MPGGREDIPYLAKSSKLLYKAGWRDKPSSTHPESDCAYDTAIMYGGTRLTCRI